MPSSCWVGITRSPPANIPLRTKGEEKLPEHQPLKERTVSISLMKVKANTCLESQDNYLLITSHKDLFPLYTILQSSVIENNWPQDSIGRKKEEHVPCPHLSRGMRKPHKEHQVRFGKVRD